MFEFIVSFLPRAIAQGIPLLYGSTGEIITAEDYERAGIALIYSEEAGFMELVTGETLLEGGFDDVKITNDYIYVKKGGTWTIYQANVEK